jgi:rubredoxin
MIKYACGVCGCSYDDYDSIDPDVEIMEAKMLGEIKPSSNLMCQECGASGEEIMLSGYLGEVLKK